MARLAFGSSFVWASFAVPTTIKLGQDVDYPPYAFKNVTSGRLEGFGIDIARGLQALCSDTLEFEFVETRWGNCWSGDNGGTLGASLEDGTLDGCMTYTHTFGRREELLDFSYAILKPSRPAGLLTRLVDGCPVVDGGSDLSGKTVVDVAGWAPTADGLGYVENKCSSQKYSTNYTLIQGTGDLANDASLQLLLDGSADAMFVYADQAENYQCNGADDTPWDCALWEGFGTTFAYVQTGQMGHAANSTTLAISKKGSNVPDLIDPCLTEFLGTEEYFNVCQKHGLERVCYPNSFFPDDDYEIKKGQKPTNLHAGKCSSGYCPCTDAECGESSSLGKKSSSDPEEDPSGTSQASATFMVVFLLWIALG